MSKLKKNIVVRRKEKEEKNQSTAQICSATNLKCCLNTSLVVVEKGFAEMELPRKEGRIDEFRKHDIAPAK